MTLTAVEAVRLKSADRSDLTRETSKGDGSNLYWKLQHTNISGLQVRKDGLALTEGLDYTEDLVNGVVTFTVIPAVNTDLDFTYYWSIYSDTEIQYFLDEAGGDTTIATAHLLLAWAADAARLAKRQTLSGGGGLGQVVIDTSVAAKELRETAKALINIEKDLGESIPAEGWTQVPWTEAIWFRELDQDVIRDN
jgi:hypothetical protein